MSKNENEETPLAVQLAEAGVEDADAIAAAVKAEQGSESAGVGQFLSNTSPNEIAQAAGMLLSSLGPAISRQQEAAAEAEPEAERAAAAGERAAADGGDEIQGSPMRKAAKEKERQAESEASEPVEAGDESEGGE